MKKKIIIFFKSSYRKKRREKIVFVLSTGRCGSTSITRMFNQHQKFTAFHEVIPELIKLSTKLAENPNTKIEVYNELKSIFRKRKWEGKKKQVLIHSDHRMWNLVEFLSDYFPNSLFIHLMRNPYDSVQSFLPRGWYTEKDNRIENNFGQFRLKGDKIGAMSSAEWKNYSRLEKCTWYWDYVNTRIENQLKDLKKERVEVIKLENIQEDMNEIIKNKFGISPDFKFSNIVTNRGKYDIKNSVEDEQVKNALQKVGTGFYLRYYK
ncbi:Sulfotransferase family protein [Salegentibacter agarivorans]|uniref:Sulfotransferase family protein n=1 Tax=Salegentibacter agarivorans TaxID=345907 RepID=A0A1I2L5C2_9FLAO|nr:Sulfotransferase family protein [Salegentibacter agarivorans]